MLMYCMYDLGLLINLQGAYWNTSIPLSPAILHKEKREKDYKYNIIIDIGGCNPKICVCVSIQVFGNKGTLHTERHIYI